VHQHQIPSLEVLKATHDFPTLYTFKAIGKADEAFHTRVLVGVKEVLGFDEDPTHLVRESQGGRHVAITIEVRLATPEEIQAVYRRILEVDGLTLLL
jgi:putative lipoic acid-binding regulatory protein